MYNYLWQVSYARYNYNLHVFMRRVFIFIAIFTITAIYLDLLKIRRTQDHINDTHTW